MLYEIWGPMVSNYSVAGHTADSPGGISPLGQRQVLNGEIVTSPADRQAIANILRATGNSPAAMAGIRTEMLNNKYSENMNHR